MTSLHSNPSPFLERRVGDILLIPISITYEQRMETHLYATEMLGIPKPKEGLGTMLAGGTAALKTKHGRMHCKVGTPISARARAEGKVKRELGTLTPGEGKPYDDAGKQFILDLGYEVVHAQQNLFVITVPSIFASLVLLHSDQGATSIPVDQLVRETAAIAEAVIARGHTVDMHLLDNTHAVCTSVHATLLADLHRWMRPLSPAADLVKGDVTVAVSRDYAQKAFNTILLAHSRNETLHVFAVESLFVLAWATLSGGTIEGDLSTAALFEEFRFMLQLLYTEVVMPVYCEEDERKLFDRAVHRLATFGMLKSHGSHVGKLRFAAGSHVLHHANFVSSFLSPFVQCCANVTAHLIADESIVATPFPSVFLKRMHKELGWPSALIGRGCTSAECLSQDTLKNSLDAMVRLGAITMDVKDAAGRGKVVDVKVTRVLSERLTTVVTAVAKLNASKTGASTAPPSRL